MGNKDAVDRLDRSKMVAEAEVATMGDLEVPEKFGEPWWDRTTDPLLKSALGA